MAEALSAVGVATAEVWRRQQLERRTRRLRLVCAVATVPLLVTYQDDGRSAPWPMWPFAAGLFVAFMASNAASWRAQARAGGPGYRRWAGVQSGVDVIGVLFAVFAESYDPKANAWTALLLVGLVAALRAGSRAALATAAAGWAGLAAIVLGLGGLSGYAVSALVYSAMLLASVAAIAGGAVDRLMAAAAAAELAQQRLARQAGTDGLTGLANRLAFDPSSPAAGRTRLVRHGSGCWCWTSTASRRSTTGSGTPQATSCCKPSRPALPASYARGTFLPVSAGMSSLSSSATPTPSWPPAARRTGSLPGC